MKITFPHRIKSISNGFSMVESLAHPENKELPPVMQPH